MVRCVILGLAVIASPLMLEAQGLSPAAVIPTQFLWSRDTAFVRPAPATAQIAERPEVTCAMPVARSGSPAAKEGGISAPPNHGEAIMTARSVCRNPLEPDSSDSAESRL